MDTERLFREHAGFVASFAYRLGARTSQIDDLVQDVFLLAHQRGGYRPGAASPTTFLARLTLEAVVGTRRRERRFVTAQSADANDALTGAADADPSQALALQQAARKLQSALEAIPDDRRAVFVLFELHGESCEAIASAFDLKIGTVYSRLHAARREFHAAVERLSPDEHGPERRGRSAP